MKTYLAVYFGSAEQKIEQAAQINPKTLSVIHSRFLLLMAQKKYDELSQISAAYLSADEKNASTLVAAASDLLSVDSTELKKEAVKLFEQAVKIAPASKAAQIGLATTLYQTGEALRAASIYEKLLEQYPNDIQILINLARIMQDNNQNKEAVTLLERAVKIVPASKAVNIALATALYQTGYARRAVSIYQELLGQYPDDIQILNNLAWIMQDSNQNYETALKLINRALDILPDNADLLDTKAVILAKYQN